MEGPDPNKESFKGNDGKVCFFTDLPSWDILQKLFKYVHPCLSSTSRSLLSPFQQLLLTLMRLRLNLSGADLGFRFNIHMSTVSRIFTPSYRDFISSIETTYLLA